MQSKNMTPRTERARIEQDTQSGFHAARDIVLGIDPGTAIMGYGVVARSGSQLTMLEYGVLTTPSGLPLYKRLQDLYSGLLEVIERFHPQEVAVEELFFARNSQSALTVGQARGVAMLAAANSGLTVDEYTPLQVKQAISGYGRASKDQMQQMVTMLLGLDDIPQPDDAADALAIAICHLHTRDNARLLRAYTEE
jgi:crossover junction endodeoxyribonuclease RuvC